MLEVRELTINPFFFFFFFTGINKSYLRTIYPHNLVLFKETGKYLFSMEVLFP